MTTYHHGDLRPTLLRAAARVLERKGRDAVSLRELARGAGVSHAAPYRHFADRQALLAALAAEGHAMLEASLAGKPWRDQALAYLRFALANPERFRLMFEAGGRAGLRLRIEKLAGEDAKIAGYGVWAMVHGLAQLVLAGHFAGVEPDALAREILAAVRFALPAQRSA